MLFKTIINENERGFLFKNGTFKAYLSPGYYKKYSSVYELIIVNIQDDFNLEGHDTKYVLQQIETDELSTLDVKDHELAIHYIDGHFQSFLTSGEYVFWDVYHKHTYKKIDQNQPEILDENIQELLTKFDDNHSYCHILKPYEKGIFFCNQLYLKHAEPGQYYFWDTYKQITLKKIDTRIQEIQVSGQEIMTKDKVPIRINFICQYNIVNIDVPILEIKDYEQQLYLQLQMIIREYVGHMNLDELLNSKKELAEFVFEKLKEKETQFGANFVYAGLKDIILPGEIRDIMNTVLIAEKKAHANVITRREETASTRSLLNTAKLMDDNKTLFKLKELEYLERICDRVGHISVSGNDNILEQLSGLFK